MQVPFIKSELRLSGLSLFRMVCVPINLHIHTDHHLGLLLYGLGSLVVDTVAAQARSLEKAFGRLLYVAVLSHDPG